MHFRQWKVPLSIGVGGTLDFLAGRQIRAPRFFQRIGLEWFWRMASNPRRLFKRYAADAWFLVSTVFRFAVLRHAPVPAMPPGPAENMPSDPQLKELDARIIPWQPLADLVAGHEWLRELEIVARQGELVFDLAGVRWLRSHELGLLVALNKTSRAHGHATILWRPGTRVLRLLRASRLDAYLSIAPRAADWIENLREARARRRGRVECSPEGIMRLLLPFELTAANLAEFRSRYEQALPPGGELAVKGWSIHAAHLQFLDSAALGFLVALHKSAQQNHGAFSAMHWNEIPRRILRTAKLENLFAPPDRRV